MPTGTCGKNLTYRIDGGTLTISGAGNMDDCKIGQKFDWYRHGLAIKNVDINAGVASVGHYAFMRDTNLTRVSIPSDTDFIGHLSFYGCTNLTSVTLKNFSRRNFLTRNYIDGSAFAFCIRLSAIEIPPNIEFIGDNAFHACTSLTSVTLPAALNQIGNNVFSGCTRLQKNLLRGRLQVRKQINRRQQRDAHSLPDCSAEMEMETYRQSAHGLRRGTDERLFSPEQTAAVVWQARFD